MTRSPQDPHDDVSRIDRLRDDDRRGDDPRALRTHSDAPEQALPPGAETYRPLIALLREPTDHVVGELCAGRPVDFARECREHVEDNAYFLEEDRVAAKVIATLASVAGAGPAAALDVLDGLVEDATAEAVEEGPLADDASGLVDDPRDDDPPLVLAMSRRLGVAVRGVLAVIPRLNALEYGDRHVVYHCAVRGLTPREYAEQFDDDPRVVQEMIEQVTRLAIEAS